MAREFLDSLLTILTIFIILSVLVLLIAYYIHYEIMKLPENTPEKYKHKKNLNFENKTVVVCIGDSITHGRISANYVRILRNQFSSDFEFVNAGINSNLAWNVQERLTEIVECDPDIITILIGTNDANALLSLENSIDYVKRMKLPQNPDLQWYKTSLEKIVLRLTKETDAQIALLTLPTIGESPDSRIFLHTRQYCEIIQETAKKYEIDCLPLHDIMINYLLENPAKPRFPYDKGMRLMLWSVIQHYLLLRNWDTISKKAGFKLHLDYLHLNTQGATMIAELIGAIIKEKSTK